MPATFWEQVRDDIIGAVKTTWTDVGITGHPIYHAPQVERINWANALTNGKFDVPYCVIQESDEQDPDWPMVATVYKGTIWVHRVIKMTGADAATALKNSLKSLQDYLQSHAFTNIQVLDTGFGIDVTESNPITRAMLDANFPFSAGGLRFQIIVGEY